MGFLGKPPEGSVRHQVVAGAIARRASQMVHEAQDRLSTLLSLQRAQHHQQRTKS